MKYLKTFEDLSDFIGKVKKTKEFATVAHSGVYRKGLDEKGEKIPYIMHPDSVAKIVHSVKKSSHIAELIAAAYLHDTVQDTEVTYTNIRKEFGDVIMNLVKELTSDQEQLKLLGKEKYLINKMLTMSSWALVIKLADRLHNLSDFDMIMSGDPKRKKWAKGYATQTKNIIEQLESSRELSGSQKKLVKKIKNKLKLVIDI